VGVGALAGSTIMLLTIPWGLSIIKGGVTLGADGSANYKKKSKPGTSCLRMGITPEPSIRSNALVMVMTALIYLLIQGPAFAYAQDPGTEAIDDEVATEERWWALVGLVVAVAAFIFYIWLMAAQGSNANHEYVINAVALKAIEGESPVTLAGVIAPIMAEGVQKATEGSLASFSDSLINAAGKKRLETLIKPFYKRYDANGDGHISTAELRDLLRDLGEAVSVEEAGEWMRRLEGGGASASGTIELDEFTDAMLNYIREKARQNESPRRPTAEGGGMSTAEEDDEEEEEMPEDLAELSPAEQQRMIKMRAATLMSMGLALILVFSDPMVEVMSNVGTRIGVPPFYVAFVLAPLASNASELIASLNYAGKKTKKTITVSLAALEGAACMNNTFCLAIFMALVFFKHIAWKFTAETVSILICEFLVAIVAIQKTMTGVHAAFVLCLYPLAILLVALLEAAGYD